MPVGAAGYIEIASIQSCVNTIEHLTARHVNLDPGALGADDQLRNLHAVREDVRVFSAYELRDGTRIWIITEADRSVTTILLPEEYSIRAVITAPERFRLGEPWRAVEHST